MNELITVVFVCVVTICTYVFAKWLYHRIKIALLLPVAVATFIIVMVLIILNISYETYMVGGKWIKVFLGPAIVSLAYPLYQNKDVLKKLSVQLIGGTLVGSFVGVFTGVYLVKIIGFNEEIIYTITPKSITIPVAVEVSTALGGIESLAAVFVMIAGISGGMLSTYIFKYTRLTSPIGRGVGLGSASHAIGTEKAFEYSKLEGSISTVSMILSALFVSIIAPFLVSFLL